MISNVVSNVTPVDNDTNISKLTVDPHLNSNNGEVNNVLDSVIARMHGVMSSFSTGNIQLGPVLTAEVSVEGEIIEALLDTGSPVTIIQLEALLEILAKQRHPDQTISEWRTTTESCLEPTSLILKNYSGDNLKIVRQKRILMSRPGYSTSAMVQVQSSALAKLLVGTDLLSRLGYFFVQASEDDHDLDMLATESEDTLGGQSIQQRDGSNKERYDDAATIESDVSDNLTQSEFTLKNDTSVKEGSTTCATGTVCLVQATRIPARHKIMVRVKISEDDCVMKEY